MSDASWQKATASDTGGCIQMRRHDDRIQVRDSKDPECVVLTYHPSELAAWMDGVRKSEFDHLLGE